MKWWFKKPLHISWLIAGFCFGVIMAVIVAPVLPVGLFGSIAWLLTGLVLAVWGALVGRRWCLLLMIVAGLCVGGWRGGSVQADLAPYQALAGYEVTLRGVVSEDVDIGRGSEIILRLKNISIEKHELPGQVWVTLSDGAEIKRSDRVVVTGKIQEGFGGFSASMYRAELVQLMRPQPGDIALQVRDNFADNVREGVPEPQASLGIGFLVGQRRALPPELDEALKIAGLTHIVVASGYNLTILVRVARRVFVKVSKYLAALSAGGMIVAFIAVTGASPSMSRAGLVAGLSLLAWYYGRKFHPMVLLPVAAAITLLINPSYGWNDLGWQLSFAAFAGVMILAPLLQSYFFGDDKPGMIRQILGETLSAQLCTLPIIAVAFGVVSNVALLANLLILPLVPLAMLLTFIAGIAAAVAPSLAEIIALPATWLLGYMVSAANWVADLSWAQTEVAVGGWFIAAAYAALLAACVYMWRKTGYTLRNHNIVE